MALFRKEISTKDVILKKRLFHEDLQNAIFKISPVPATKLFAKSIELSGRHSARLGTRSLDLMHVAAALLLHVDTFFSFDARQCKAAKAEGLKVKPSSS